MTATPADDTPTGPALAALLRGRLREVSVLVEQRGEAALAGTSLSLPLNHLLDAVVAEPGVTVTTIAGRLGKSQQAISQAADRLEKLHYVERRVGPGRAVALHATPTGLEASAEGVARELAAENQLRELLGHQQFDTLMTLLAASRDTLLSAARRPPAPAGSRADIPR